MGEIILCELPAIEGHILYGCSNGPVITQKFYPIFSTDTTSFYDVVEVHETIDCVQYGQASNYFLAKNVGIIRKEYLDSNHVWRLARNNIVQ